jgi:hypothetical protein
MCQQNSTICLLRTRRGTCCKTLQQGQNRHSFLKFQIVSTHDTAAHRTSKLPWPSKITRAWVFTCVYPTNNAAVTVRGRLGLLWNILKVKHVQRPSSPEPLTDLQSKSQVLDGRRRSPKAPWPGERRNGWVKTRRLKMKHKAVPPGSRLVHQRNKFLTPV